LLPCQRQRVKWRYLSLDRCRTLLVFFARIKPGLHTIPVGKQGLLRINDAPRTAKAVLRHCSLEERFFTTNKLHSVSESSFKTERNLVVVTMPVNVWKVLQVTSSKLNGTALFKWRTVQIAENFEVLARNTDLLSNFLTPLNRNSKPFADDLHSLV
jgi:hypothetical protein